MDLIPVLHRKVKRFYYEDGTNVSTCQYKSDIGGRSTWGNSESYSNPNFSEKKVSIQLKLWLKQRQYGTVMPVLIERRHSRIYRYPSNTNVGYLTLNIPPYMSGRNPSASHFEVNMWMPPGRQGMISGLN